eukprot:CAMPEP_0202970388 /NCGR_PEP_ID=MMETSP1396-20130829/16425_1 /ASSEMBLY_ACC=CAM_ASM_000872 /TAXON_ID= /ORGANISM="Pseudokeronopsis sp., Strain Brazil" /LENGTH=39 /DNA_ID= /DNA_START= /DNA_END= /DNA_ORIENTATION=
MEVGGDLKEVASDLDEDGFEASEIAVEVPVAEPLEPSVA